MGFLQSLLNFFSNLFGPAQPEPVVRTTVPERPHEPLKGSHGLIEARSLIMAEGNHVVLVVDHEFLDVPAWVEWDKTRGSVCIAQNSGAVAEIRTLVPQEIKALFEEIRTILLMTRFNNNDVAHRLSLIVHD